MELLIVIGIIILIFILTLFIYNSKKVEVNKLENQLAKNKECSRISNLISLTQSSGEGISINTSTWYNVTINSDGIVSINDGIDSVICTASGNIISNIELENAGFNITNINNQIIIEKT